MQRTIFRNLSWAILAWSASASAQADPWLAPGDLALRHDIQLLADAGVIHAPTMTWPMSWPDIARDLGDEPAADALPPALQDALRRVRRAASDATSSGRSAVQWRLAANSKPTELRQFSDTPREQGEAGVDVSWTSPRVAGRLAATVVADPSDKQSLRLDNSYVGVNLGNFMVSAGLQQRWWGPGWDGSLILGNNARPIPSLTIERVTSAPFQQSWLRWVGPWRASFSVGQAEGATSARDGRLPVLADTKFLAARLDFRPRPWLEIALSRTAQFCGAGRRCSLTTFKDVLIGHDNQTTANGGISPDQPGNQLAGYDIRLTSPWKALPAAVYTQFIGEDEANGLPSKFMGLIGAEVWGRSGLGSFRVRAEIADTAVEVTRSDPEFNTAYRNGLYVQGYTYRGRIIGHAMDNDGRMYSTAVLLVRPSGEMFSATLRKINFNRGGVLPDPNHAFSAGPSTRENLEFEYKRTLSVGQLTAGLGVDRSSAAGVDSTDVRSFVEWRQRY